MPVLTPYAAQEIAMVSSTPCGSGLPIGLMPGALPSDQASRQTLNTTAMRLWFGHSQSAFFNGMALLRISCAGNAIRKRRRCDRTAPQGGHERTSGHGPGFGPRFLGLKSQHL